MSLLSNALFRKFTSLLMKYSLKIILLIRIWRFILPSNLKKINFNKNFGVFVKINSKLAQMISVYGIGSV
jgi:hypothetical protein